jgi:lipopolysaccharide export system protein LptA
MLQAPYLLVKYEGKAADGMAAAQPANPAAGNAAAGTPGARVTALWVRNGVEITAGTDRRITSETVDFDVAADTAVFAGNVVATQDKNVLKGGRLLVDRKAGKTRLEPPDAKGRIWASFQQSPAVAAAPARRQPNGLEAVQETMGLSSFKTDRTQPMNVEADRLDILDASGRAVFTGDVQARQGGLLLHTAELTAFTAGQTGMGFAAPAEGAGAKAKGQEKGEVVRLEAKHGVTMETKEQAASAKWAKFDVKANTALLGGDVTVTQATEDPLKRNVVVGDLLKVDMTTGVAHVESTQAALPQKPPAPPPAAAAGAPAPTPQEKMAACPPGRICTLFHPQQAKDRALEVLKKKAPGVAVP